MSALPRTAFITGVTGQDGRYLTALLKIRGYAVHGLRRNPELPSTCESEKATSAHLIHEWDMRDTEKLVDLLERHKPSEFYNFAAYSTGRGMFDDPVAIGEINGLAVTRILEAIRTASPATRFCQASSAEMFGATSGSPQSETSRLDPRSPYGAAKAYAHNMVGLYRSRYAIFGCSAILFNHESPLRGDAFLTRKVARAAAAISLGLQDDVVLGDLAAQRDWGFAGDYVHAMWLMLQADAGDDYVIATGIAHRVEDVCRIAFARVGLNYLDHVRTEHQDRVPDPLQLVGDPHKAADKLSWSAVVSFEQLINMMVDAEVERVREAGKKTG